MNFVKIHSCPQGTLSYRAPTASMPKRRFSPTDKYVQKYWIFKSVSSRLPTIRLPLYGHEFQCLPNMDIRQPVPGYEKLQFKRYSLFKTPWNLTQSHSFSIISCRIYEIILRQSREIYWFPNIILYNWDWRGIIIDNRTRRRNYNMFIVYLQLLYIHGKSAEWFRYFGDFILHARVRIRLIVIWKINLEFIF